MNYSIFVSLLICFILCTDDVEANFTKEACTACCNGLYERQYDCGFACAVKFSMSQDYNSRRNCERSCTVKLYGCRQMCLDDCTTRYEALEPGAKVPSRKEQSRLQKRKASEFLKLTVYKTTSPDPNTPKRFRGFYKPSEGGSSSHTDN